MKQLIYLAFCLLIVLGVSNTTLAANKKAKGSQKAKVAAKLVKTEKVSPKAKLGTSFKFDATSLKGKYQNALGTNATVENDKYLDDLLAGRKDFKDRITEDVNRN